MRILVTGASGVFGRDLASRLQRRGHEVVAFSRRRPIELVGMEFVAGDIRDGEAVAKAMAGCDVVAHLAWQVSPLHSADETEAVNLGGTANVLEAMARTGCRRLVFSSSVLAYGSWPDNPERLREEDPLRPDPPLLYAYHKARAEDLVREAGVELLVTRTCPVAGRQIDNYAFRLFAVPVLMAIKGENPRWQFIHQEDVGRFHVEACESDRTGTVNVAHEDTLEISEIADILGRRMAVVPERVVEALLRVTWKYDLFEFDPDSLAGMRYMPVADTSRLREEWGFTCAYTGREAVEDLARKLSRLVCFGRKVVDVPWRLPWVRNEIPRDVPAADGTALAAASPPDVGGRFDNRIDPRFTTYTATNLSEAFPGVLTPLTLDYVGHAMRGSADGSVVMFGLEEPVASELRARGVAMFGHRAYVNVSVLRSLAEHVPGMAPEDIDEQYLGIPAPDRRRRVTAGEALRGLRLLARVGPRMARYGREVTWLGEQRRLLVQPPDALRTLPDERLEARIRLLHDMVVEAWHISSTGNLFVGGILGALEKAMGASAVASLRSGLDDLASGGALLGVRRLADELRARPDAAAAVRAATTANALATLRQLAPDLAARFDAVVARYGHRGPGETELANPVFADDSSLLVDAVVKAMDAPAGSPPPPPPPAAVPARLRRLVELAHRSMRRREEARDAVVALTHELRLACRERGRRLADAGTLARQDDVFYLTYAEVLEPPGRATDLVAERRAERERLQALVPPMIFTDEWQPAPTAVQPLAPGEELKGLPASPGVVRGRVRIVGDAAVPDLQPGEVLVARTTDVGWTPLFAYAVAVVTDIGALVSHAAVVAREFGVPCVVGTGRATTALRDGQLVEVDGAAGRVTVVEG